MTVKERKLRRWFQGRTFSILGLLLLCCCAPQAKIQGTPSPPIPEFEKEAAEAESFYKKGCYIGFKKSIEIYQDLYARPSPKNKIVIPFVKALILMAVRERELGILNDRYLRQAAKIIEENPPLHSWTPYLALADRMPPKTRGVMRDIDVMGTSKVVKDVLTNPRLKAEMKFRADSDEFDAYLYATFYTHYSNYLGQKEDLSGFVERFPNSILFKYKNATTYPRQDPRRLEALAEAEPEFYEAFYHLGELALGIDQPLNVERDFANPLDAEKKFLKAQEGIPESPQIPIYLGSISVALEEFDEGLEYYEKTLALAPTYRDALLGKSVCLSSLGKFKEAIDVLNTLVAMGFYLLGESHYWLARNHHERHDLEKAQLHIEESLKRLPADSEVFALAGTIALEKNELDKAEKAFIESLRFNGRNIKSVLGLGRVYAEKKKWLDSAKFYSHAAKASGQRESELAEMIGQIKNSTLAEGRKAKLVAKKEHQREILVSTEFTACYDAAVGYANAGQKEQALEMAEKAASHPPFKEAAEKLIQRVKKQEKRKG